MAYELIITEKPSAAQKIAEALADHKATKKTEKQVSYFILTHNGKDIVITSAVGHLYTVEQKEKGKWTYPVFDIHWVPSSDRKGAEYTKKYVDMIKKLSKGADTFTIATDYDIEGEVIGLNVVRYACSQKDARRMKFSTLTKPDLIESYGKINKHLDWGQAHAGETRHFLDWMYGINLSRALTLSIRHATGQYKIMSAGRVQGPALKMVVDKEKEINKFKSDPYWEVHIKYQKGRKTLEGKHKTDKFWKKPEVDKIMKIIDGKDATVKEMKTTEKTVPPPTPFDLTTLQMEAHRCFGIAPKRTLEIAQELYTAGFTSYPRTSSQKLPATLGYKKLLAGIAKQPQYKPFVDMVLKLPVLTPNEGKKDDPAHPAIYPTGIVPKGMNPYNTKIYDLVVKRFLATFCEDAKRASVSIYLDVNGEPFTTSGSKTTYAGWHDFYAPYVKLEEVELPELEKGEELKVKKREMKEKETQPPKRYTEASVIKELEKRGLGTKATRAAIVDALVQRKYITEKPVEATELGMRTCNILHKYSPIILEEQMTRDMEAEMEIIRQTKSPEAAKKVLKKAEVVLTEVLNGIKDKEKKVGKELADANIEMQREENTLGKCPVCKEGSLAIKRSKFGRFIACDAYPDCKTTLKIPQTGIITKTEKQCEHCEYPTIKIGKTKGKAREVCINPKCPSKKIEDKEIRHEVAEMNSGQIEKECPKCKENKLVLRTSVYGKFLGCSGFPKCRFMEPLKKLEDAPAKEDFPKVKTTTGASKAKPDVKKASATKKASTAKPKAKK